MQKTILRHVFLLFLLAGIVYACMDEDLFSPEKDLPPEVSAAQKWYDSQVPDGYIPWTSANGVETNTYKPDWQTAVYEEDKEWKVTEVHLVGEERLIFSTLDCMEKYKETGDERYNRLSDTRLLIRTHKETKETDGYIMIVYPDLQYLEAHLNQPLRNFSYLKRNDINFGGVIHYNTLDGNYLNGWLYKEGVAYAFVLEDEKEDSSEVELRDYQMCDYVCEYTNHYTDWYVNGDYSWTQWRGGSENCYYTNCRTIHEGDSSSGGPGGSTPPVEPSAVLSGSPNIVLMSPYNLRVSVMPNTTTVSSVKFVIDDNYTLQNGQEKTCNLQARKPGVRTIYAIVNGNIYTNAITVNVQFPDVSQIKSNVTIASAMAATWQATKNTTSSSSRNERGFWILVNTNGSSLVYEKGIERTGNTIFGCEGTQASLPPGASGEQYSQSPLTGGKYAVAFFHTHTPLTYCPYLNSRGQMIIRPVGPSGPDVSYHSEVPGLVYDYVGTYNADLKCNGITGGHSINAVAQIYTIGPSRRIPPSFW